MINRDGHTGRRCLGEASLKACTPDNSSPLRVQQMLTIEVIRLPSVLGKSVGLGDKLAAIFYPFIRGALGELEQVYVILVY